MAKKNNKLDKRQANIPVKVGKKETTGAENVLIYKDGMTVADVALGLGKTNAQIITKLIRKKMI